MSAITVSAAIFAIESLLKFRIKADEILALKEAAGPLPIDLPNAPYDFDVVKAKLLTFYATAEGKLVLELRGKSDLYAGFSANPDVAHPATKAEFLRIYYDYTNSAPVFVGPKASPQSVMPGGGAKLSYYIVESHRLSRNTALTRLLLASAETLLEFGGANAELFVANPKTRKLLSTILNEFVKHGGLDDDDAGLLLRRMLNSVVVAAIENQGAISENSALSALIGALADLREAKGDNFVAEIFTKPGFQALVGNYLTRMAEDPAVLGDGGKFRPILSAVLKDLAANSSAIFDNPKALFGVLEVAVTATAEALPGFLDKEIGDKKLLSAVLKSVLDEVKAKGEQNLMFKSMANGEIVSGLFKAALGAVASNSNLLGEMAKLNELSAALVSGIAVVLTKKELNDVLSKETLRDLASKSLQVLAANQNHLSVNSEFTSTLLVGFLEAAASAVQDGLSTSDVAEVLDAAIRTANENLALVNVDVPLLVLLEAVGAQLSETGVRSLLQPDSRMELILLSVETLSKNPKIWSSFKKADLVMPIVEAVIQGLASDSTEMLKGPVMVAAYESVVREIARQGGKLIDGQVNPPALGNLISIGLQKLASELGNGLDADEVPSYLRDLVDGYLKNPFALSDLTAIDFKELHRKVLGLA